MTLEQPKITRLKRSGSTKGGQTLNEKIYIMPAKRVRWKLPQDLWDSFLKFTIDSKRR